MRKWIETPIGYTTILYNHIYINLQVHQKCSCIRPPPPPPSGNPSNPSWISLINLPEDGWPVSTLDYDNKMPNQTLASVFCRRIIEPSEGLPASQSNLLCIYNNNKQVGRLLLLLLLLLKIPAAATAVVMVVVVIVDRPS